MGAPRRHRVHHHHGDCGHQLVGVPQNPRRRHRHPRFATGLRRRQGRARHRHLHHGGHLLRRLALLLHLQPPHGNHHAGLSETCQGRYVQQDADPARQIFRHQHPRRHHELLHQRCRRAPSAHLPERAPVPDVGSQHNRPARRHAHQQCLSHTRRPLRRRAHGRGHQGHRRQEREVLHPSAELHRQDRRLRRGNAQRAEGHQGVLPRGGGKGGFRKGQQRALQQRRQGKQVRQYAHARHRQPRACRVRARRHHRRRARGRQCAQPHHHRA